MFPGMRDEDSKKAGWSVEMYLHTPSMLADEVAK